MKRLLEVYFDKKSSRSFYNKTYCIKLLMPGIMRFSDFKIFFNFVCNDIITEDLGFRALLLYTISKAKLGENILVSQSIVSVEVPQYCRFDSKKSNEILFNVRIANLKFTFFILKYWASLWKNWMKELSVLETYSVVF